MTIRRRIERELAAAGPGGLSIRRMAQRLDADRRTVANVYQQLGIQSRGRPGRPSHGIFADRVGVYVRLPAPVFDCYARAAIAQNAPVSSIISRQLVAHVPRPRCTNFCK